MSCAAKALKKNKKGSVKRRVPASLSPKNSKNFFFIFLKRGNKEVSVGCETAETGGGRREGEWFTSLLRRHGSFED